MKIALVHDYLCGYGGSERIFEYMCQEFKEADIYTLSYNKNKTLPEYKSYKINTTFLNTFVRSMESFRWSFPIATYVMENINLSKYDIVLSSSATVAKYVNVPNGVHICYCYIPTRALWQKEAYFNKSWKEYLINPFLNYLKKRDFKAASKVDYFISQSMDTQSHIKNIYQKDSDIINGPIDISRFKSQQAISNPETYLLVSRLENWKKVDYAIDAFNILKLPLRIVGSGKESSRLMKKANQNIKFLGSISDEELAKEYSSAKAVIFTPYLEYGLIPLEANACGTPVIAYGKGGIEETMIPFEGNPSESTAIFFHNQSKEDLIKAVYEFEGIKLNRDFMINHAKKWSIPVFKEKLREYINEKSDGLIKIIDLVDAPPYKKFIKLHNEALDKNQIPINAIAISSYDAIKNEVDSRYVNLKYIYCDEWIFFTNYSGPKSEQFKNHNQISAIIYWDSIDVQIRIKANIKKTDKKFSDQHYKNRSSSKNAIAISSKQSAIIDSYESVMKNYKGALKNSNISNKRPSYWGGYSFTPYYFEFWEGNKNRINKRQVFEIDDNSWNYYFLQP